MTARPFEDLVHRVNNLLGTIEMQSEVARAVGTLEAHAAALATIVDSARKTHDEVRRLRALSPRSDERPS